MIQRMIGMHTMIRVTGGIIASDVFKITPKMKTSMKTAAIRTPRKPSKYRARN
ncbi:MAG: hypothetical protein M1477_02030 [Candidatus Thermoplasmatota archaeon]|nr:hypothetical protein [Candidatus Thermoplasmatota archaeon]